MTKATYLYNPYIGIGDAILKAELERWDEVVGEFVDFEQNDQWLRVKLNIMLVFPLDGMEAKIIMKKLRKVKSGQVIGIRGRAEWPS